MKKLTTGVSVVLAAVIAVACQIELVGSPEYDPGSKAVDNVSHEAEWVGFYEGTGSAELLDTGDSYSDLPVCLETWVEAGRLRGAVYIQLGFAPADALMEISDNNYSWDQEVCAGLGVTMTASCSTEDVTSKDGLLLLGRGNSSWPESGLQWSLRIERLGDKLVGSLDVEPLEWRWGSSTGNKSTVARFSLYVTRVN